MADYLSKFSGEEIDSLLDKIKDFNVINEIPSKSITDDKIADSSITTSLLSNGSVTMQKLGNDVTELITEIKNKGIINESRSKQNEIDIKTNQNFSLFNSDRLNILEAQINADKNTIEYTSDKPLEITCDGANIIDCNAHFKKVEGQTRRYSLNLWEYSGRNEAHECDVSINGQEITVTANESGLLSWCGLFNKHSLPAGTYTAGCFVNGGGQIYAVNSEGTKEISARIHGENDLVITHFTIEQEEPSIQFRTDLYDDSSQTKFTNLFIYEGNLSKEDLTPFQPYDNTLVNSKATFVSTGRNLFKFGGKFNSDGATLEFRDNHSFVVKRKEGSSWSQINNELAIPKGTYYFGCNVQGSGQIYVVNSKGDKEISPRVSGTDTQLSVSFTTNYFEEHLILRIVPTNPNESVTFSDLYLSKADTGYEPYIKNISQYDIELGAYDYIENGNLVRQTSEVGVLDGKYLYDEVPSQAGAKTKLYRAYMSDRNVISNSIITNSKYGNANAAIWGNDEPCIGLTNVGEILIRDTFQTAQKLQEWLKTNHISYVYKKAILTITPIVVPNGIVSYKNGLTSQEIKGKYLPYKYTAKYVNGGQQ